MLLLNPLLPPPGHGVAVNPFVALTPVTLFVTSPLFLTVILTRVELLGGSCNCEVVGGSVLRTCMLERRSSTVIPTILCGVVVNEYSDAPEPDRADVLLKTVSTS